MNISNYKKASVYDVEDWLHKSIPDLSDYQKRKILQEEVIRYAPFEFFETKKRVKSFWWRLTIFAMPIAWVLLIISLPFNFIAVGSWGYGYRRLEWFYKWRNKVGL